jgi:hypothetical protein
MNNSLEYLALRKQLLQARTTLYRLRLRHEVDAARNTLGWAQAGAMAAQALPLRSAVLGLALYGVSRGRLAQWLALSARVLLVAKAAGIAVGLLQKPPPPAAR